MSVQKLQTMRGSEKLKIQAAVLEVMETKGFSLDKDFGLIESTENPANWIMAFTHKSSSLDDLENVRGKLGSVFKIQISSKSKEHFLFRIEGPAEEFIKFGQGLKALATPSQPIPPRSYSPSPTPK